MAGHRFTLVPAGGASFAVVDTLGGRGSWVFRSREEAERNAARLNAIDDADRERARLRLLLDEETPIKCATREPRC